MKQNRRFLLSLVWLMLGAGLIVGNVTGLLDDYWGGMGGGFLGVAIVQIIRRIRYKTNEAYREAVDVASSDERNKFLSGKAWAMAGYLFVLIAAAATIVLQIIGKPELSTMAGFSVCLLMILYWLSWLFLRKKY